MNPKGDVTLCSWYSHSRKPYRKGFYCSAILSLIGVRRDQSVTAFKIALSMVSCCLVTRFKAWTLLTYSLVLHPHSGHAACTPGSQYAHLPRKTLGPPQNGHGGKRGFIPFHEPAGVEKISEIAEPFQLERVVFYILKMVFLRVVSINSHNVTSCIGPYRV